MKKSRKTSEPFNETEMEIIRADIAFLKDQAKKDGTWDKWLREQKAYGSYWQKSNREIHENVYSKEQMDQAYGPGPKQRKPRRKKSK